MILAVPTRKTYLTTSSRASAVRKSSESLPVTTVLVELSTSEGITGYGESPTPLGAEVTKSIVDSVETMIFKEDPFQVEMIRRMLFSHYKLTHVHIHAASWALSGVEMALWDIIGKSCRKPLYKLWGGAFRKKIPFMGWISREKLENVSTEASDLVEMGFKTLFTKVGFDPDEDIKCIGAIRDAVGYDGIEIRVDANQSWSPGFAVRIIKKMERFDLEFVEQPVLMQNLEGMARVRRSVNVPILSHESSWTFYDALNVIKKEAADALQLDPRFDAGFIGARIAAGMAEAAGLPVVHHCFSQLGVATGAFMHLIASCVNFTHANQTEYPNLTDDIISGGPWQLRDGCLSLPEDPGIGIEIDQEKVEKYSKYYRKLKRHRFTKIQQEWSPTNVKY